MPQLDRSLVKERASRLRTTGHRLHQTHLDSMVGTRQSLLVENNGLAHTENFTLVAAPGLQPRAFVPVTITGHNGKHLDMQLTVADAA
jgi:threonylcarbamoyladenosine tRNA methylthiotransferase MtaB